ncbi:putative signal transducing protein [Pedobacter insulae]|uniref:Putative signal transducing protein n=1 Tax=Pedobacter insulae TaxID=414048 RepID=A0A1I2W0H9_9SPHI|nr:DUF2007 domain-containing protein [Pedobacter insulae]SFG94782.1 Putative signal transducing protein [Pedobacter insulae]
MEDKIVVYSTFQDPVEANIVLARLKDAGFSCFLSGENTAVIYPLFDTSISGVQLHVFEGDVTAIKDLLAEQSEI